ncbi:hypothetical protein C8R41DRAFT_483705 [Lentinula lateritia]|uniref:Uncharacterized protein n=1 Tax=Lentinula lateritia TaxID=40482 RepID=A0ABQ8VVF4_9AGAR|nr:hypothetical protein C8R41DRAFT_483705 [Lentinula lateritia]
MRTIFGMLFFFATATMVVAAPPPLPPTAANAISTSTGIDHTSTSDPPAPTSADAVAAPEVTQEVTAKVTLNSDKKVYLWENDARSAVKKLLNFALDAALKDLDGSDSASNRHKSTSAKLNVEWAQHKYAAAPPEFSFTVKVTNWPGKTGSRWLWGRRPSAFQGTLRLVPSQRCPSCHLPKKKYNIIFGQLSDGSNARLVTIMNDKVVAPVGTENNDIPLLTLPPPAIVKEGPSSYLGRTGPRTSQKSSRPTTQKNGGGLETLKENEELEAQTGEVKGKGKAKE